MEHVPDDCIHVVFEFLDDRSFRATRLVCKALREVAHAFAESKVVSVVCILDRLRRDLFFRKTDVKLACVDMANARHELRLATDTEMRYEALLFLDTMCSHVSVATTGFNITFREARYETRRLRTRFGFFRRIRSAVIRAETHLCQLLSQVV